MSKPIEVVTNQAAMSLTTAAYWATSRDNAILTREQFVELAGKMYDMEKQKQDLLRSYRGKGA